MTNLKANNGADVKAGTASASPGDGIRSVRTTSVFQIVNFELYAKPVSIKLFI